MLRRSAKTQEPAPPPGPRVFAVANQKGGVGKTTTTVNLGACFAELGRRVLIIDLDPQANASTGLGLNPRQLDHSLYDVLLQDVPLEDAIEPVSVKNLFVAPASLDLAGAEIELVPAMNRERKLKDAIESVSEDYDIDGDYIEAAAFAWLAFCNLNNLFIDWKQVTGASKSRTLGVIFG